MPKVFTVDGLDYFFYSNEGHEPMHIHVRKGRANAPNAEAKFWIDPLLRIMSMDSRKPKSGASARPSRRAEIINAWRQQFGQ